MESKYYASKTKLAVWVVALMLLFEGPNLAATAEVGNCTSLPLSSSCVLLLRRPSKYWFANLLRLYKCCREVGEYLDSGTCDCVKSTLERAIGDAQISLAAEAGLATVCKPRGFNMSKLQSC